MVDRRKPVMRAVRPVVGEIGEIAIFVFADDQTVAWPPVIFDRDAAAIAAPVIAAERDLQLVAGMREPGRASLFQRLIGRQPGEIERDLADAVRIELK